MSKSCLSLECEAPKKKEESNQPSKNKSCGGNLFDNDTWGKRHRRRDSHNLNENKKSLSLPPMVRHMSSPSMPMMQPQMSPQMPFSQLPFGTDVRVYPGNFHVPPQQVILNPPLPEKHPAPVELKPPIQPQSLQTMPNIQPLPLKTQKPHTFHATYPPRPPQTPPLPPRFPSPVTFAPHTPVPVQPLNNPNQRPEMFMSPTLSAASTFSNTPTTMVSPSKKIITVQAVPKAALTTPVKRPGISLTDLRDSTQLLLKNARDINYKMTHQDLCDHLEKTLLGLESLDKAGQGDMWFTVTSLQKKLAEKELELKASNEEKEWHKKQAESRRLAEGKNDKEQIVLLEEKLKVAESNTQSRYMLQTVQQENTQLQQQLHRLQQDLKAAQNSSNDESAVLKIQLKAAEEALQLEVKNRLEATSASCTSEVETLQRRLAESEASKRNAEMALENAQHAARMAGGSTERLTELKAIVERVKSEQKESQREIDKLKDEIKDQRTVNETLKQVLVDTEKGLHEWKMRYYSQAGKAKKMKAYKCACEDTSPMDKKRVQKPKAAGDRRRYVVELETDSPPRTNFNLNNMDEMDLAWYNLLIKFRTNLGVDFGSGLRKTSRGTYTMGKLNLTCGMLNDQLLIKDSNSRYVAAETFLESLIQYQKGNTTI